MTMVSRALVVCNVVFMLNGINDTANTVATSTQPVGCPHSDSAHSRTLCISRTDQQPQQQQEQQQTYQQLDGITLSRRGAITDDLSVLGDSLLRHGIHPDRCCTVCHWPRRKFYNRVDEARCDEHCIREMNLWFFRPLKQKNFTRGSCANQGYPNYLKTTLDKGVFPLPSDVFGKLVVLDTTRLTAAKNNSSKVQKKTLADYVLNFWVEY